MTKLEQWHAVKMLAAQFANEAHRVYFEIADFYARIEDLTPEILDKVDGARDKLTAKLKPLDDSTRALYESALHLTEYARQAFYMKVRLLNFRSSQD